MAVIASAAQPNLRGTFMSLNGTVQSLAMGLATTLAGFLTSLDGSGRIVGYPLVGDVSMASPISAPTSSRSAAMTSRASFAANCSDTLSDAACSSPDKPLIDQMMKSDLRFGTLIEHIVRSRQFRDVRGRSLD